jgi:hypothetical protein
MPWSLGGKKILTHNLNTKKQNSVPWCLNTCAKGFGA